MSVSILEVSNKSELRDWVLFPYELYRDDPLYVPQIIREEIDFFSSDRNPGFQVADTKLLLARRGDRVVGRVCGIIHRLEEEKLGYRRGRFGWFECVEDDDVALTLLRHLEEWFVREGCREMTGPHGFTDLDPEGLLIDGLDALPTIAGSYNKGYYRRFLESFGLEKDVDYVEHRFEFPAEDPLFHRIEKWVRASANEDCRIVELRSKKEIHHYLDQWWDLLEASFEKLYGVTPLTAAQKAYYTKKYFDFVDPEFLILAVDRDDRVVGMFLALPSLSRPFQKARGKLFPFGFLHILKGFKEFDTLDFYFAGVHPEVSPTKVLPAMTLAMFKAAEGRGVKFLETNRELESNTAITGIWSKFPVVNERRSRVFRKSLGQAAG